MKRTLFHILFWALYLAYRCLIEYAWIKGTLPGISGLNEVMATFTASILESLPEILFAYYVSYRTLNKILTNKKFRWWFVAEALIVLLLCIYSVRLIFASVIAPYVYQGKFPSGPFEFKRFLLILFNFMATAGIMIAIRTLLYQRDVKAREQLLLKEKMEAELKFLKNQVNPHFLFNTLNSIYGLARKKSEATPGAILKLSELLSYMLYDTNKMHAPVCNEIKVIDDYIELQKLRYGNKVKVNFRKDIDDKFQDISPLLLIPMVENAFKFGVGESTSLAYIDIDFTLKNKKLNFVIQNSIEQKTTGEKSEHIGLNSLRRQLELMYKEHELTVFNNSEKFKVILFINLDTYGKNEMSYY